MAAPSPPAKMEAARSIVHYSIFKIWQAKRRPSWVFPATDPHVMLLDSLLHTTTHASLPNDPAALPRLIATRHNFARVAANLPALALHDALAVPIIVTIDAASLDAAFVGKPAVPLYEDREVVAERVLASLEALVRICGSPAWQFELIIGGHEDAGSIARAVGALVSGCLLARGLASCRVLEAGPEGHSVAAAKLALAEPRLRVLLASASTESLWATLGASAVMLPVSTSAVSLGDRITIGKLQLVENRATALLAWDAKGPTSYDASVLCGGGRSGLHSPAKCFMIHFAAGEGLPGVFVFEDVSCDACGAGLSRKDAFHDYFFCMPCNWAACGPCFRAADKTAEAGERAPPLTVTKRGTTDMLRSAAAVESAYPDRVREVQARFEETLSRGGISFVNTWAVSKAAAAASMPPRAVTPETCAGCGAPCGEGGSPLQRCSRCRTVAYCGPTCQRAHWKRHKAACKAAEVAGAGAAAV